MAVKKGLILFFLLTLVSHFGLFLFKNRYGLDLTNVNLQQDNYLGYVFSLQSGNFPETISAWDSRLFPGLPFLIYFFNLFFKNAVFSGLFITFLSLTIIYFIANYFTKQPIYSFWLTLFPPVIFEQGSKISTETLVIALLFLAYFLFAKEKYLFASLLLGYASIVRPISVCLFFALLIFLIIAQRRQKALSSFFVFLFFPSLLTLFNFSFWPGESLLRQFLVYPEVVQNNPVILQILLDIKRTIAWGQPRILFSGLTYLIFAFWLFIKMIRSKSDFLVKNDRLLLYLWAISTFVFIFSFGPNPILEDIRRYLAIFFPLALLANYKAIYPLKIPFYLSFLLVIAVLI